MKPYLYRLRRPARYLGNELHSVRDPAHSDLRVGLAFPDLYEIGMSNLGMGILYHALNAHPGVFAERVFAPDADLEELLRSKDIPLATLETQMPLNRLDILGFSLQYELTFTNILTILDLGGIPIHSSERTSKDPLILAGGPCAFNPEPLSDFIDAFVIGDGEYRLLEVCRLYEGWKASGSPRQELLRALSDMEGIYVPSFFEPVRTGPEGTARLVSILPDKQPVRRCIVRDLDAAPFPDSPLVPYLRIVHDRLNIEVARGCRRGCRFCQAGVIYHPARERSPGRVYEMAIKGLERTGYEEVSLLSLSIGDYSELSSLVHALMNYLSPRRIGLSLPSLRVGSLEPSIMEEILRVRKTGFTFAPEAATTRLQSVINKRIGEDEIVETTRHLYKAGWNKVKLYFMIGLPTETDEDVEEIAAMAKRILRATRSGDRGFSITVNVSTFVPKPHTPFQWERQISREAAERKHAYLREHLVPRSHFRFKWHDPRLSLLEGVFARGDRRLGAALEEAYRRGCRFDGWTEYLRFDLWEKAFDATGIDPDTYLRGPATVEAPLPWDWIDTGIKKTFLYEEHHRALGGVASPLQCNGRCADCRVCEPWKTAASTPRMAVDTAPLPLTTGAPDISGRASRGVQRVRIRYSKEPPAVFLSHLETMTVFQRALRRANLPVSYSQGLHPHPRVSFGQALAVGIESLCEYLDIFFEGGVDPPYAMEMLNSQLPEGLRVLEAKAIDLRAASLEEATTRAHFRIVFHQGEVHDNLPATLSRCVEAFLSGKTSLRHVQGRHRQSFTDLRSYVKDIRVLSEPCLHLSIVLRRVGETFCSISKILEALWALEPVPEDSYVIQKVDAAVSPFPSRPRPLTCRESNAGGH